MAIALPAAESLAFVGEGQKLQQPKQTSITPSEAGPGPASIASDENSRRTFLSSSAMALTGGLFSFATTANAKYILNDDGDYEEVLEEDWQTTWKQRLEKAQSMGTEEVFNAARGAGNLDLREGEETESARKRRAMSACRNKDYRAKASVNEKDCNMRVMAGETDFILS
eukprot:CAMPEP_0204623922 /NCGR_PEP_ID=MMETSP0717-20131115/9679_1 /ASSEMBLY_ACC=CAM_ASM_000666 /TAXON_ID=230516 /ORGANISM="Chaetoceros curvisetus" /LENGTH=168 /DNA_ID=CAMNT_0051639151 /DNA_START=41 /DNA_END=547 /DNA_ORIENTATION=+